MNHRQRMIAGNKIQQMLKNKSYKKFPFPCEEYVWRCMRTLKRQGMEDKYAGDGVGNFSAVEEGAGGWLFELAFELFKKSRQTYSS